MNSSQEIDFEGVLSKCADLILTKAFNSKSGHIGGSLSLAVLLTPLMYDKRFSTAIHKLCISKGHASLGLYSILYDLGLSIEPYERFCSLNSPYHGHINQCALPDSIIASTGSLGHGLPIALGYSYHKSKENNDIITYCFVGDGEFQEGSISESLMLIGELSDELNLKVIIDCNGGTSSRRSESNIDTILNHLYNLNDAVKPITLSDKASLLYYNSLLYSKGLDIIVCDIQKGIGIIDITRDVSKWHAGLPKDQEELAYLLSKISFRQFQ